MSSRSLFIKNDSGNSTDVWLTPPEILHSLGDFDLDPCAAQNMPWRTADKMLTKNDDGLSYDWSNNRVWLNPPYSNISPFMERMGVNNVSGIALVFNRTDTAWFQDYVFDRAHSILFIRGRLNFCNSSGIRSKSNGGAGSALAAYSKRDRNMLQDSGIGGKLIDIN